MVSNEDKERVWAAHRDRRPIRVPVALSANPRVVILDPQWNPGGVTFEDYFTDADALVEAQLRFMDYRHEYLHRYCDSPVGTPEKWEFYVDNLNSYDSLYFGCPIHFRDGQIPDTTPILAGADKDRIFEFDLQRPMENLFIKDLLRRYEELVTAAKKRSRPGIELTVRPPLLGFDGHLTIATCLRGGEIFSDFYDDPDYVRRLLEFIHRAVAIRNRALHERFGVKAFDGNSGWFADDSVQLISSETYREFMLPLHRRWYAQWSVEGPHSIHLCGDVERLLPIIHRELNVRSFDTGFPVDHGRLRRALGPDVQIQGGPEVDLLLRGTPQRVHDRTREILQSGIMAGGRFILQEANNLPPCCPEENLAAMYDCCLEHGNYTAA
ncbi:MAG TPA: uroporphyrinogen decarboxylase family protein [Phycisphaerae bacterium]|nr:uroporphyrinogen decarboxylase family protein [Phycisphaerae bacterium]